MVIYYIYEIPGKKVGCTKNLKTRVEQRQQCKNYKILGAANNIDDAAWLEREWQIKLGYSTDKIGTYDKMIKMQSKIDYSKIDYSKIDYSKKNKKFIKPILQFDKQGNFIKEWKGADEISLHLKLNRSDIGLCCRGKIKTCGKFVWKYK